MKKRFVVLNKLISNKEVVGYKIDVLKGGLSFPEFTRAGDMSKVEKSIGVVGKDISDLIIKIGVKNIISGYLINGSVKDGVFNSISDNVPLILENIDCVIETLKGISINSDEEVSSLVKGISYTKEEASVKKISGDIKQVPLLFKNSSFVKNYYNTIINAKGAIKANLSIITDSDLEDLDSSDYVDVRFNINTKAIKEVISIVINVLKQTGTESVVCQLTPLNKDFKKFTISLLEDTDEIIALLEKKLGKLNFLNGFIGDWCINDEGVISIASVDMDITKDMIQQ